MLMELLALVDRISLTWLMISGRRGDVDPLRGGRTISSVARITRAAPSIPGPRRPPGAATPLRPPRAAAREVSAFIRAKIAGISTQDPNITTKPPRTIKNQIPISSQRDHIIQPVQRDEKAHQAARGISRKGVGEHPGPPGEREDQEAPTSKPSPASKPASAAMKNAPTTKDHDQESPTPR